MFKREIEHCEEEWTQHKKLIDVPAKKGIRGCVPRNFAYFYVDFALGGGYAHVIENQAAFPKDFGRQLIAGVEDLTPLDRGYREKAAFGADLKAFRAKFEKDFDWSKALG